MWRLCLWKVMEYAVLATCQRKQLCLLMDEVYQCSGVWLLTGLNQSVYLVSVKLIIWKCKHISPELHFAISSITNHKHSSIKVLLLLSETPCLKVFNELSKGQEVRKHHFHHSYKSVTSRCFPFFLQGFTLWAVAWPAQHPHKGHHGGKKTNICPQNSW